MDDLVIRVARLELQASTLTVPRRRTASSGVSRLIRRLVVCVMPGRRQYGNKAQESSLQTEFAVDEESVCHHSGENGRITPCCPACYSLWLWVLPVQISKALPCVSLGLTERLHHPHHHVNRPAKLNGWHAVKPPFNFCLKAISISGLLWGCRCWNFTWYQLEQLNQSCDFCWTQAPPWDEWFLIFVRKFSNSFTHSPPSWCALLSPAPEDVGQDLLHGMFLFLCVLPCQRSNQKQKEK